MPDSGMHQKTPIAGEESPVRSEEHTSELQSPCNLVCRLLLEKKNDITVKSKNLPPEQFVMGRSGNTGITIGRGEAYQRITRQSDPARHAVTSSICAVVRLTSC